MSNLLQKGNTMRIGVNTTLKTNPGDDIIRDGIQYLIGRVVPDAEWVLGQKHTNKSWTLEQVRQQISAVLACDVLVQAGSPVFWDNMVFRAGGEWVDLFWGKVKPRSVLALASGACYPLNWNVRSIRADDRKFIRRMLNSSAVFTVRDHFAERILKTFFPKESVHILPCTSLWSRDLHGFAHKPEYAVINCMSRGGHYGTPSMSWNKKAREFYDLAVKRYGRCVAVCHSQEEAHLARGMGLPLPDILFFGYDHKALVEAYSRGIVGLANRVHGACTLNSFGIPNLCVGDDTRTYTVETAGGKIMPLDKAKTLDVAQLMDYMESERAPFKEKMEELRATAGKRYLELLRPHLQRRT
jgi:hypothetical protein